MESDFLVEKLGSEVMGRIRLSGNAAYEALNHVDGKRSVADIARAVSASYGPQNIEDVVEYFRVLAEAGLIVLGRSGSAVAAWAGRSDFERAVVAAAGLVLDDGRLVHEFLLACR